MCSILITLIESLYVYILYYARKKSVLWNNAIYKVVLVFSDTST
jgi:hypothetical protein